MSAWPPTSAEIILDGVIASLSQVVIETLSLAKFSGTEEIGDRSSSRNSGSSAGGPVKPNHGNYFVDLGRWGSLFESSSSSGAVKAKHAREDDVGY